MTTAISHLRTEPDWLLLRCQPPEQCAEIPFGYCHCGCGKKTTVSAQNHTKFGYVKGQPLAYVRGHNGHKSQWVNHPHVPTFTTWKNMLARTNPKSTGFRQDARFYRERGITTCERWRASYDAFVEDMGLRPEGMSIDRYPDMNGNYEPGNCRWATQKEQVRNSRRIKYLTVNGITRTYREWEQAVGLGRSRVYWRLKNGWTPEECVRRELL